MGTAALEDFLTGVVPEVPGVSDPAAVGAIRNACYDLCAKSLVWNEVQAPVAYTASDPSYQIDTPDANTQVAMVLNVTVDDKYTIHPTTLEHLAMVMPDWRVAEGGIVGYFQSNPDEIRFVRIPDVDGTFTATVAYAPTRSATHISDILVSTYYETVVHGALWKLKRNPSQPWADEAGARYYEKLFRSGVADAIADRTRANSRALLRVAPRPFV